MKEWSASKKWNPFNSDKLLAQVYRWRLIQRTQAVPQPALITVDPTNNCNLSCSWCNASKILNDRCNQIDKDTLLNIPDFLASWQGSPEWPKGVEGVCIAGGGEPLLHPNIDEFIDRCVAHNIEVGVVTNGTNIHNFLEPLAKCTWVGISVDAGSPETFKALKGQDYFTKVCDNIALLKEYSMTHSCQLATDQPGYGISYKYLLYNGNITDILPAVKMAKKLGCKNFHLRPAGIAWDKIGTATENIFDPNVREQLAQQIESARTLEDENFGIYGITHKFDPNLNKANQFSTCHAVFMTAVFMPPRSNDEKLCFGLCCDRRGDTSLECQSTINDVNSIADFWGSREHWEIFDKINLNKCPRCTYQPHNQIYENVIEQDSMTYKFI